MRKLFTFLVAFLATLSGAVWGQTEIQITNIEDVSLQATSGTQGPGWMIEQDLSEENNGNIVYIKSPGNYRIIDQSDDKENSGENNSNVQIKVDLSTAGGGEVSIELVNIRTNAQLNNKLDGTDILNKHNDRCAFEIVGTTTKETVVTLSSWSVKPGSSKCKFWSGSERAGINVQPGATLILKNNNPDVILEAGCLCNTPDAHAHGAGIGGDSKNPNFGTIIIESGTIHAYSQAIDAANGAFADGAGIGGGAKVTSPDQVEGSTTGTILIKGGNVTAECDNKDTQHPNLVHGAGIGGGCHGTCSSITILGGTVNAKTDFVQGGGYTAALPYDIGTGYGYNGNSHPQIIIGKWDENTTANVATKNVDSNHYWDALTQAEPKDGLKQFVLPNKTQLYAIGTDLIKVSKLKAYQLSLQTETFTSDEGHTISGVPEWQHYYYAPSMVVEQDVLSCNNDKHLFMGWIKETKSLGEEFVVPNKENKCTFTLPEDPNPTNKTNILYYQAVWVNNNLSIVAKSGTVWEKGKDVTPEVECLPAEQQCSSLFTNLTFNVKSSEPADFINKYFDGSSLVFYNNQMIGTPRLPVGETFAQGTITATAKFGGVEKDITINIAIGNEIVIHAAEISNYEHVYTGGNHNNFGDDLTHSLSVRMTKEFDGSSGLKEPIVLTEKKHYRIASLKKDGVIQSAIDTETEKGTVNMVNAGIYSAITIEALDIATISNVLDPDHKSYTIEGSLVIKERPLNVAIREFTIDDVTKTEKLSTNDVTFEQANNLRGLVSGENLDVEAKISFTKQEVENKYTVHFTGLKLVDGDNGLASNYDPTFTYNGQDVQLDDEGNGEITIDVEDPNEGDGDEDGDGDGDGDIKLFRIYTDEVCAGVELEYSREVVKGGQSTIVTVNVEKGYDASALKLSFKRGLYGNWEPLTLNKDGQYQIKNIWNDIYVRAEGVVTGMEDIDGTARVYAKDGSLYIYTPQQDDIAVISMTGSVVKRTKQIGLQSYPLNQGIYVVRVGEQVFKVRVK